MISFEQKYSGSSGNLYTLEESNGQRILIETGVAWGLLQKAIDYKIGNIEGAFVSHGAHLDHSKSLLNVMGAGIDCYSAKESFLRFGTEEELLRWHHAKIVENKTVVRLPSFDVFCFETHHDCEGAIGFCIKGKISNEYLLFAIDTCRISQSFLYEFSIVAIECSFDRKILESRVNDSDADLAARGMTRINESLANRLLSSHQSLDGVIDYLKNQCNLKKCREIHLLHCSKENLDKQAAVNEVFDRFKIRVIAL